MKAERYVAIILNDETSELVRETPKVYENARIVREYEFKDGAVVEYEWHDVSVGDFNHRFSLIAPPRPNPKKLKPGLISTIEF